MKFRYRQILRYCLMYGKHVSRHQWIVGSRYYLIADGCVLWAPLMRCNDKLILPLEIDNAE